MAGVVNKVYCERMKRIWTSDSHEHQYARHDIMWKRPIEICNTAEVFITMALTLGPVYIDVQDPR